MTKKIENIVSPEVKSEKPKKGMKYTLRFLVFLIILGLAGATAYYYKQYEKIRNNPETISQEETQRVISDVSRLIELPDETPSLATVQDKDKLKDQSFFKKAENGDKILIYANAKQAILYRPSSKKIIEVAPLILDSNTDQANGENDQFVAE